MPIGQTGVSLLSGWEQNRATHEADHAIQELYDEASGGFESLRVDAMRLFDEGKAEEVGYLTAMRLFRWNGERPTGAGWPSAVCLPVVAFTASTEPDQSEGLIDSLTAVVTMEVTKDAMLSRAAFTTKPVSQPDANVTARIASDHAKRVDRRWFMPCSFAADGYRMVCGHG